MATASWCISSILGDVSKNVSVHLKNDLKQQTGVVEDIKRFVPEESFTPTTVELKQEAQRSERLKHEESVVREDRTLYQREEQMEKTEVPTRFREDHEVTESKYLRYTEEYEYEKLEDIKVLREMKIESVISVSPPLTETELSSKEPRTQPAVTPTNIDVSLVKDDISFKKDSFIKTQDKKEQKSSFYSATEHRKDTFVSAKHLETKEEITKKHDESLSEIAADSKEKAPTETEIQPEKSQAGPLKTSGVPEHQSLSSTKPSHPKSKEIFFETDYSEGTTTTERKAQRREDMKEENLILKTLQPLEKGILVNLIAEDQTLEIHLLYLAYSSIMLE